MFENILYQEKVRTALSRDMEQSSLSQSMLFHGPDFSGKLSTALELVRVLSCKVAGAPWGCACTSCSQQRYLLSPYVLLLGQRYFSREIRASGVAFADDDREGTRFLLYRAVRKLLRRFDPVLWEGEPKYADAIKTMEKIEDLMALYAPGASGAEPEKRGADLAKLYGLCDSLAALLPQDGLNARMIRHASYWAHTADSLYPKFIILENAETMNEACRNSLLKILEEPPPSVYFILITAHRQAIMPTLLSRMRPYQFLPRASKEQEVLQRIFRQEEGRYSSLRQFFSSVTPGGEAPLRDLASTMAAALLRKAGLGLLVQNGPVSSGLGLAESLPSTRAELEDVFNHLKEILTSYLKPLGEAEGVRLLGERGLHPVQALDALQALIRSLGVGMNQQAAYNLSAAGLWERLYSEAGEGPCAVSFSGR